jgi:hypothetical protein
MRKVKAIIYGKKDCHLCEDRQSNIERFPPVYEKKTGGKIEFEIEKCDISTVDGLVRFCMEERTNSDIPVVVLEEEGKTLKVYHGPTQIVSSRLLLETLVPITQ